MGYKKVGEGTCPDCHQRIVQLMLDTDVEGDDDWAGVGWFHVINEHVVREGCAT